MKRFCLSVPLLDFFVGMVYRSLTGSRPTGPK
jgi:hypothetical protein